jgi:hypothetical protein
MDAGRLHLDLPLSTQFGMEGRRLRPGLSRFVRRRSAALPEVASRLFRVGGKYDGLGSPNPRGRFYKGIWIGF